MKRLTISYGDSMIHFCPCSEKGQVVVPHNFVVMDDNLPDLCFDRLKQKDSVWVWLYHGMDRIVKHCMLNYTYVKAAGGLVEAPDGEWLLIRREGNWDIPKGMVEAGESLRQTALREVHEETGLSNLAARSLILKTYHIYNKYGGWHLKQTSWFGMRIPAKTIAHPQQEEGIDEAVWMSKELCLQRLEQSFASLHLVAERLRSQY